MERPSVVRFDDGRRPRAPRDALLRARLYASTSSNDSIAFFVLSFFATPPPPPFYTKRCRGGVQRRQLAFKGVAVGD
jgi:hypothetical protein